MASIYSGPIPPKTREDMRSFVDMFKGQDYPKNPELGIYDPRVRYGLTDADINNFRYHDSEIKEAIDRFTGMDFPLEKIDDVFLVEIAGMVQKLGVGGAVLEANKWPRRVRALYRSVCRNIKKGVI